MWMTVKSRLVLQTPLPAVESPLGWRASRSVAPRCAYPANISMCPAGVYIPGSVCPLTVYPRSVYPRSGHPRSKYPRTVYPRTVCSQS